MYVVDQHNHRIQKFSLTTGSFLLKWGEYDPLDGQRGDTGEFDLPTGIALDSSGQVYVTDTYNNRVQKFDSGGNYLDQWGSQGSSKGQFDSPTGIAIDQTNNIYVADTNNNRIQKFDSDGNYLMRWGTSGNGDGQFSAPGGVAASGPGEIYVTDVGNHRVQKFGGLWLTKKVATTAPAAGEQFTYIITVINNGPVTATHTLISDTLNSDLQLAGPIQLVPPHPEAVIATSPLSLPVIAGNITLSSSSMLTITVPVTVNAGVSTVKTITNTAAITSSEFIFASRDTALIIANGHRHYFPLIFKQF
jgi:tripartite motif-containing protein 71